MAGVINFFVTKNEASINRFCNFIKYSGKEAEEMYEAINRSDGSLMNIIKKGCKK